MYTNKVKIAVFGLTTLMFSFIAGAGDEAASCPAFLNHDIKRLHSSKVENLCDNYKGKTILIVNTASNCGYTPQFKSLEALYSKYKEQDFVVLGFPSDNFFQEEDEEKETAKVCYTNYGVTFPMYTVTEVRGGDVHPVFAHLADKTRSPKWNFYKYLVSSKGEVLDSFSSRVKPDSTEMIEAIEVALKQ